jgi:hypothetical protein
MTTNGTETLNRSSRVDGSSATVLHAAKSAFAALNSLEKDVALHKSRRFVPAFVGL